MMKQYVLGIVLLSLACIGVAFKEEDCEGKKYIFNALSWIR